MKKIPVIKRKSPLLAITILSIILTCGCGNKLDVLIEEDNQVREEQSLEERQQSVENKSNETSNNSDGYDLEIVISNPGHHIVSEKYDYLTTTSFDIPYGYKIDTINYLFSEKPDDGINRISDLEIFYINTLSIELKKHTSSVNQKEYYYEDDFGTIIGEENKGENQYIDEATENIICEPYTHIIIIKRNNYYKQETVEIPEGYEEFNIESKSQYKKQYNILNNGNVKNISPDGFDVIAINNTKISIPGYYDHETNTYYYDSSDFGNPVKGNNLSLKK